MGLASKYRPKKFDDVVEQGVAVEILKRLCENPDLKSRNFLFTGPAGTGKAQPMNSKVLTPQGFIPMKDVTLGTKVYTIDGDTAYVSGVFPQGKRTIYKIFLDDGTSIKVSDEHLNIVKIQGLLEIKPYVLTTNELLTLQDTYHMTMYIDCPQIPYEHKDTFIDPYLYGALLVSTYFKEDKTYLHIPNADVRHKVCKLWSSQFYSSLKETSESDKLLVPEGAELYQLLSMQSCYFYNDVKTRTGVFCGILDCIADSVSNSEDRLAVTVNRFVADDLCVGAKDFTATDFMNLSRSLGIFINFVVSSKTQARFEIKIPETIVNYKQSVVYKAALKCKLIPHSKEVYRKIKWIKYNGEKECQCIYVEHSSHSYISDNFIPTHNTTLSRIIANTLNNDMGTPIEIDAASHSGVDDMREVIQQAKLYPVGCNYKCFIIDECFTGDTKVLTDKGFKRFDELDKTEQIAQYHCGDGSISFTTPIRYVHHKHLGDLYDFYPLGDNRKVTMTPKHVQCLYNTKTGVIREQYISDVTLTEGDCALLSGFAVSDDSRKELSKDEKKFIRKYISFAIPESDMRFSNKFNLADFSYSTANEFIRELFANSHSRAHTDDTFMRIGEIVVYSREDAEFITAVGTLGGYISEYFQDGNNYIVRVEFGEYKEGCKPTINKFSTRLPAVDVYCVEVPTHHIVVQTADGLTFITGNCHSLSNQAWQSLLKPLEDNPAKSVFLLCTTNPEKIPNTILSRVQTFNLSKISVSGIYNRLVSVITNENAEGKHITYTEDALYLLAKMANGGMRNALTLLDKVLSYSNDITSKTIVEALNLPKQDDYFSLLSAYAKGDNTTIASIINTVYNSGVNFTKWIEDFQSFIINLVKYIYLKDINATTIPEHYTEKLDRYDTRHAAICLNLSKILSKLLVEMKNSPYQQEIALSYLCR